MLFNHQVVRVYSSILFLLFQAVKAITKKTPKKAPKKKKEKKPKAPGQRKVVKKAVAIKCVQVFGRKVSDAFH